MTNTTIFDLPRWPEKGQRRKLEQTWIEQMERHGLPDSLIELPATYPTELTKAVEEFNSGLFWECHETLEEVWLEALYPMRFFYHAMIKAAVGFHHMGNRNRHGARVKMADSVQLLPFFQPYFMGVRTDRLLNELSGWLARVERDDVDWDELHAIPVPRIEVTTKN